jgi:hypothetical protein
VSIGINPEMGHRRDHFIFTPEVDMLQLGLDISEPEEKGSWINLVSPSSFVFSTER